MANSAACPTINAITASLKRQTLVTPTNGGPPPSVEPEPVPPPRRSLSAEVPPRSKPRTKFAKATKELAEAFLEPDRTITDENAGPAPRPRQSLAKRDPLSPAKSAALPPRPTQSDGLPRLSVRAFHVLPSTPNSAGGGLAELPTSGAAVRRELSISGPGSARSPPLAPPPLKRFCRSLTEETASLPRPKPLRPAATNTATAFCAAAAPSTDHMRSLIASRRLRAARNSSGGELTAASTASAPPMSSPVPSSFVPYPRGGLRTSTISSGASSFVSSRLSSLDTTASALSFHSNPSSGYASSTASLLESTLGAVEPELEEIEAAIPGGGRLGCGGAGGERPHAPSPDSRALSFDALPLPPPPLAGLRSNPALTKEKCEGNKVYRLIAGKYEVDRNKTGEDFYANGARTLRYDLPEVQERPPIGKAIPWTIGPKSPINVPAVWLPCAPAVREDSEGEEREEDEDEAEEEEEEEELTLMEESRRSSHGDLEDLDLDSMEKDDSWRL